MQTLRYGGLNIKLVYQGLFQSSSSVENVKNHIFNQGPNLQCWAVSEFKCQLKLAKSELLKDSDNWLSLGVNKMIFDVATWRKKYQTENLDVQDSH